MGAQQGVVDRRAWGVTRMAEAVLPRLESPLPRVVEKAEALAKAAPRA